MSSAIWVTVKGAWDVPTGLLKDHTSTQRNPKFRLSCCWLQNLCPIEFSTAAPLWKSYILYFNLHRLATDCAREAFLLPGGGCGCLPLAPGEGLQGEQIARVRWGEEEHAPRLTFSEHPIRTSSWCPSLEKMAEGLTSLKTVRYLKESRLTLRKPIAKKFSFMTWCWGNPLISYVTLFVVS